MANEFEDARSSLIEDRGESAWRTASMGLMAMQGRAETYATLPTTDDTIIAMAMSEDLAILIAEMDANFSHLESITTGLSREQFNWRPEAGRWSIGECVGHLNIVNAGDLAPLQEAIQNGRARGRTGQGPFQYGFLSRKFIT